MEVGGLAWADARAPDIAWVGGACCDADGWDCLASRWRTVATDKTSGYRAAAARPVPWRHHPSPPIPALPLRARGSIVCGLPSLLPLLFGCMLLPAATFHDASATEGRLELPQRDFKHVPRPSSRTVRARRRKVRCRCSCDGGTGVCGTQR